MASEPSAVSSVLMAIVPPHEATIAPPPIFVENARCVPKMGLPDQSFRRFMPC